MEVLGDEKQFGRLGRWGAPGEVGGQILPADPLADVLQRDRATVLEVPARHGEQFWSLQVRTVPRRMAVSASAVLEERAKKRHFVLPNMSRISAVVVVSPSLGKMLSLIHISEPTRQAEISYA